MIKLVSRRVVLALSSLALLGSVSVQAAPLIDNLNIFVPASPGGGWDTTGRTLEKVGKAGGFLNNTQVENVSGAGGMVGLPKFVNQYKNAGNALMLGGSVMVGAGITNKSPVTIKDVTPIAQLTEEAGVIVVPAEGKIKTWKDLEAALKSDLKGTSVAGGSAGGTDHQLLALIVKKLGGNPKEAAYVAFSGGGAATAALLGNQVKAGISGYSEFEEHIKSGKLIALAVSGKARIPGVDVPTLTELGMPVVLANWRGVFAGPEISAADKAKLIDVVTQIRNSAGWKEELAARKWIDVFSSGDAFAKDLKENIATTEELFKELGL